MSKKRQYDILIIGGGVAGSAAATTFARQGREVLLVERSLKEPHRIVGELLQPGGVAALSELGMSSCLDGIDAIPVKGYHIYWKDEGATFLYPLLPTNENGKDLQRNTASEKLSKSRKRPEGKSFHHGRFIMNLRAAAKAEPNLDIVETTAIELLRDEVTGQVLGAQCKNSNKQLENVSIQLYCSHIGGAL